MNKASSKKKDRTEILSIFGASTSLSIEQYFLNFMDFYYTKTKSFKVLEDLHKQLMGLNQVSLNLADEADVKVIVKTLELLAVKDQATADEKTVKQETGISVSITGENYKVEELGKCVAELKTKGASSAPAINLKIVSTPTATDPSNCPDIGLNGLTLQGKAGQRYWTVGNAIHNDIVLPKTRISLGTSFVITHEGGKFQVKDQTYGGRYQETMLKCRKEKDVPLAEGDVLSLSKVLTVKSESQSDSSMKVEFLEELVPSSKGTYETDDLEIELEDGDEKEANIGRSDDADIVIAHEKVSGSHCKLRLKSVFDTSAFGTFKHLRTGEQDENGEQSSFVEYD